MRYAHVRYLKSLFTNIQKHYNMLKISLLFKKFTNFASKQLENSYEKECEIFRVLLLYEHEHIMRFSNLRYVSLTAIWWLFIRPHLDYGDIVYDQAFNESFHKNIESIQYNTVIAIIGGMRVTSSVKPF